MHRHTVRTLSSPKNMLHKSSYTLEKTTGNSINHLHPNYQQYSKSVDHSKCKKTIESQHHHRIDDIPKQSNIHNFHQQNNHSELTTTNYPTSSVTGNAEQRQRPIQYEQISLTDQSKHIISHNITTAAGGSKQIIMENQFTEKNLSAYRGDGSGISVGRCGVVDTIAKVNKFQHESVTRKRDEYQQDAISDGKFLGKQSLENVENLYGRIQSRGSETLSSICGGNYDRCNANSIPVKRFNNENNMEINCVNNNNHYDGQLHNFHSHYGNNNNHNNVSDTGLPTDGYATKNKMNALGQSTVQTNNFRRTNGEGSRKNMLRTNRYSNGSHLTAPGAHNLSHMMNTLSSPESAYSTGYSTDGTSPGKFDYILFLCTLKLIQSELPV